MENNSLSLEQKASLVASKAREEMLNKIGADSRRDALSKHFAEFVASANRKNFSQYCQDLFVCFVYDDMESGGYLEFGAADGVTHSNSLYLAKNLKWHGILIEPYGYQFQMLHRNRPGCVLVRAAVRTDSERSADLACAGQLSSLLGFHDRDYHKNKRLAVVEAGRIETTPTMDLSALCRSYFSARYPLHYMSVDVEGAELAVLSSFDFGIGPGVVTVEFNHRADDELALDQLFESNGYTRVFRDKKYISGPEAWYVQLELLRKRFGLLDVNT